MYVWCLLEYKLNKTNKFIMHSTFPKTESCLEIIKSWIDNAPKIAVKVSDNLNFKLEIFRQVVPYQSENEGFF